MSVPSDHRRVTQAWGEIYRHHPTLGHISFMKNIGRLRHQDFFKILRKHIALGKNNLILEAGCGSGTDGFYLASLGNRVVSLDYYQTPLVHLTEAKHRHEHAMNDRLQLHCLCNDLLSQSFHNDTFDLVFNSGVIEHYSNLEDRRKVLQEMKRVTKQNGLIVVAIPNKRHPLAGAWEYFAKKFSDIERYEIPEQPITVEEIEEGMKNIGLKVIEARGIDVYNTLSRYPQWFFLRTISYCCRVFLPFPSLRLSRRWGVRILVIGKKV